MASIRGRINIVANKIKKSKKRRKIFIKRRNKQKRNSPLWKKFQSLQLRELNAILRRRQNLKALVSGRKIKHEVKKVKAKGRRTAIGVGVVAFGLGSLLAGGGLKLGGKKAVDKLAKKEAISPLSKGAKTASALVKASSRSKSKSGSKLFTKESGDKAKRLLALLAKKKKEDQAKLPDRIKKKLPAPGVKAPTRDFKLIGAVIVAIFLIGAFIVKVKT